MTKFNGMVQDESEIMSKCNRCREALGRIEENPYQRICTDCQSVIDRSLARFYAKAAVKKAIKRAKKRPTGRSN